MMTAKEKKSPGQLRFRSGGRKSFSNILVYGVLILWALLCLFPVYWMITFSAEG